MQRPDSGSSERSERDEVKVIIVYYVGLVTRLAPSADVYHDIDATYCAPRCYNSIPVFMHGVLVNTVAVVRTFPIYSLTTSRGVMQGHPSASSI
jgi:hypothetical protein